MEKAEDKKMIAEMNDFLADKAKAKSADDPKAEEQLPFESIDSYSTDPVGFGEMSLRMLSKVEFVFDLAAKENRFSSKYLKRCTQLEKGIKYLGSLCVTKYALQTKGQTFSQLGQLSTEKLYCMTSHHYRKLDMAVTEYMFEHRDVPDKLFDMELRYFNLLERLRSTEVKIEKFHDKYAYGETDYSPIVHGLAFSEKSWTKEIHRKHDEAPAFRHAPAFSAYGGKLSGVSGQGSENEEGRMKNEDVVRSRTCEGSDSEANGSTSLNEEASLSISRPSTCQREQLSKAGSNGKVAEAIELNKKSEIENKNDEKGSGINGQGAVREERSSVCSDEKLPPCLEIMKRVVERSRETDDDSLTFTIEEMEFLAKDPLFASIDPAMASEIRKILDEWPPG